MSTVFLVVPNFHLCFHYIQVYCLFLKKKHRNCLLLAYCYFVLVEFPSHIKNLVTLLTVLISQYTKGDGLKFAKYTSNINCSERFFFFFTELASRIYRQSNSTNKLVYSKQVIMERLYMMISQFLNLNIYLLNIVL